METFPRCLVHTHSALAKEQTENATRTREQKRREEKSRRGEKRREREENETRPEGPVPADES